MIGVYLYGDNLYGPPHILRSNFIWCTVLESIFSTTYEKEEVRIESYMTMMIRVMWYVFGCKSFIQAQISLYIILHISMLNWNNAYIKWANFRKHHLYQLYLKISRSTLKALRNMYDILRPRMSLSDLKG